jgi:hypothetical protein
MWVVTVKQLQGIRHQTNNVAHGKQKGTGIFFCNTYAVCMSYIMQHMHVMYAWYNIGIWYL